MAQKNHLVWHTEGHGFLKVVVNELQYGLGLLCVVPATVIVLLFGAIVVDKVSGIILSHNSDLFGEFHHLEHVRILDRNAKQRFVWGSLAAILLHDAPKTTVAGHDDAGDAQADDILVTVGNASARHQTNFDSTILQFHDGVFGKITDNSIVIQQCTIQINGDELVKLGGVVMMDNMRRGPPWLFRDSDSSTILGNFILDMFPLVRHLRLASFFLVGIRYWLWLLFLFWLL